MSPRYRFLQNELPLLAIWAAFAALAAILHSGFLDFTVVGGACLIVRHFASVERGAGAAENDLVIAALAPAASQLMGVGLWLAALATPRTLDRQLAWLDAGAAPAIHNLAVRHPWAMFALDAVYLGLPLAMMLGLSAAREAARRRMWIAMLLGAVLALPWYFLFPAVGPAHLNDALAPRNCMPSMHLTWALFLPIYSRGTLRILTGVFAGLIALATLATGEHYLPDLVAAVPWTIFLTLVAAELDLKGFAK